MIAFVKGILEDIYDDRAVVDVNGIGINVMISPYTASVLPPVGSEVKIHTYTVVREDAFLLFGFMEKSVLELFCKVITVNGIGPKGGQALLSYLGADGLRQAIIEGDVSRISKTPGVGKKSAEKMIIDLQDKIKNESVVSGSLSSSISREDRNDSGLNESMKEAIDALCALGYSRQDSKNAVLKVEISDELDTEAVLKEALKHLI